MKRMAWITVLVALAWVHPAAASTRLGVFIVADDAALSNNLTEVAIARLAEKPGYELLGLRELEVRLNELTIVKGEGIRACFALPACLSDMGAMAGLDRALIGDVRHQNEHYRLDLTLVDSGTGTAKARYSREALPDLDRLISAVQAGVFEIVPDAEVAPKTPVPPVGMADSPPMTKATSLPKDRSSRREQKGEDKSVLPYVAYGGAALAVVALSAAAVTGTLGSARPTGASRREIQDDLERRKDYASFANVLYASGGVLAGASVVAFVMAW